MTEDKDKPPGEDTPDLFSSLPPDAFGGATYEPSKDFIRLKGQLGRVWDLMKDGEWRTLAMIRIQTGDIDSEPAISARLRDFRKEDFGAHIVERKRESPGLFAYRLVIQSKH